LGEGHSPLPSAVLALPLVERRASHAVPTTCRRAPPTTAVLARVVEESPTGGIGTFLHARKITTTEQGSSGFADGNEQLTRLLEVRLESSLETQRSLDQSRGARWFPNHLVKGLNGSAWNRAPKSVLCADLARTLFGAAPLRP
jgi:hypothetical protein